jgi:beta-lactam-binding protein with PASTA domain
VVVDEDSPPSAPPPIVRPYPWWLWLLVVLLLAAAILFFVLWLLERNDKGSDVPLLIGLSQVDAQNKAAARGFTLKTVTRPGAGTPGRVIDQAPQSGANLERGSQVMAVMSTGRKQPTVPKLVGSTADAAEQLLSAQGLQATRKTVDSTKPKGIVVSQGPTDGTRLSRGSTVTLSVSSGKGRVEVPAVQGMSQSKAVTAIVDAGLVPVVIQIPSQQPQGTVLAQDPAANQQAPAQSKVRINVSGGPAATETETVTTSQTATSTQTSTTTTARTTTARVTTTTP